MMTPQEALDFLSGARFENYSGQIIAEHANKNKDFILCDLTCECSEVGSKNADEYGEALITLLNSIKGLLAKEEEKTNMHTGRFELRVDEDTGRRYWWGGEDGWKDPTEIGEDGVLIIDAKHFTIGTILTLSEPDEHGIEHEHD